MDTRGHLPLKDLKLNEEQKAWLMNRLGEIRISAPLVAKAVNRRDGGTGQPTESQVEAARKRLARIRQTGKLPVESQEFIAEALEMESTSLAEALLGVQNSAPESHGKKPIPEFESGESNLGGTHVFAKTTFLSREAVPPAVQSSGNTLETSAEKRDLVYVVFCRVCGTESMATSTLAAAHQVLIDICEELAGAKGAEIAGVNSSVYGLFLRVKSADGALDAGCDLLAKSARKGVHLAIGIAVGKLHETRDLDRKNVVGHPINLAARMAALKEAENTVLVSPMAHESLCDTSRKGKTLTGPAPGQMKQTSFKYYRLDPPKLSFAKLKVTTGSDPGEPAHVVVYDLAGFSGRELDEQWEKTNMLRQKVEEILTSIALDRFENGQLWYAPAGDGGVLVYSPVNNGADAAFRFARALAEECGEKVEIRVGIATGKVVVIKNHLPVGQGVLLADKLSAKPPSWQICVSPDYWSLVSDGIKKSWRKEPLVKKQPEDPDGFVLSQGTQAGENAKALFIEVINRVRRTLKENAALGSELQSAIRSGDSRARETAGDIIEMAMQAELNSVLKAIYHWLAEQSSRDDIADVAKLLNCLLPLGVDPEWVRAARDRLPKEQGGFVAVPMTTELLSAEVIKAAIVQGFTGFSPGAGPPCSEDGFSPSPHVEPTAPTLRSRLEDFRTFLLKKCDTDGASPAARKKLEQVLKVRWEQKKTLYALFEALDNLETEARKDDRIPWHYLLVMKTSEEKDILPEPYAMAAWLKGIFNHLDRLDTNFKTRNR